MSSEHDVRVVRIGKIMPHPNADALSMTEVDGRPALFRTGDYAEGDLAVYIPVDTLCPVEQEHFAFLRSRTATGLHRVRAMRLRGVFSMGLLVPVLSPEWSEGDDVAEALGTTVWHPPLSTLAGNEIPDPGIMPVYTDIESLRRWSHVFDPDERVVATEKIHGANARMVWSRGQLWVGSRTRVKGRDPSCIWWRAAEHGHLAEKLATMPDVIVYGEVYGQVQDLRYGVDAGTRFVAFDAMDALTRTYLDVNDFRIRMGRLSIPAVPVLWEGRYGALARDLANGQSILAGGACIREGFVVRPIRERFHAELGRVVCKCVGEDYLTRKGG